MTMNFSDDEKRQHEGDKEHEGSYCDGDGGHHALLVMTMITIIIVTPENNQHDQGRDDRADATVQPMVMALVIIVGHGMV